MTLVAPSTLLPVELDGWPVKVAGSIDDVLDVDVIYLLRAFENGADAVFVAG